MPYDKVTAAALALLVNDNIGSRARLRAAIENKHPGAVDRARKHEKERRWEAKFSGNPPAWAKRLVAKHEPHLIQFRWHRSGVGTTRGLCTGGAYIDVTVPSERDPNDPALKVLVLHELAHADRPYEGHGDRFYDSWYRLLRAEGLYRAALGSNFAGKASLRRAAKRAKAATPVVAKPADGEPGPRSLSDLLRIG